MATPGVAAMISDQVENVLKNIEPGSGTQHVGLILQFVDLKVSDSGVHRLCLGLEVYPAM